MKWRTYLLFKDIDDAHDHDTDDTAGHDDGDHGGGKKGPSDKGKMQAGKKSPTTVDRATAKGKKPSGHDDIEHAETEDEDSDRPEWAGTPGREGKPGEGNFGGTTKKGVLYGDIVVVVRYDSGEIVVDDNGTPDDPTDDKTWAVVLKDDGTTYEKEITGGELTELPAGESYISVEFGRMNVARAPEAVPKPNLLWAC